MKSSEAERLNSYLKLIMPTKDPERVLEVAKKGPRPGGPESMAFAEAPRFTSELAKQARAGTETLLRGGDVPLDQLPGMEAIILPDLRPAVDIIGGKFTVNHTLWTHLNDAPIRQRLEVAIPSIGRIELPGRRRHAAREVTWQG